jgi:ATP/maltotriose-dependent transcriptional regulator MalT
MLDRHIFSQVAIAEMMLAFEQEDSSGALVAAKRLEQMSASGSGPLLAESLIAEALVKVGEPERALTIAQEFLASTPPENAFAVALWSRIEGLAQQALGQPTRALECLDRAVHAFTEMEMPFDAARAHLEWAMLAAATDGAVAAQALQESLAVFERLGARRYARRVRRLLYKLGARPRSTLSRSPSETPLSPRELEIVLLVTDDMTNAEIAERLIISPRTITTHLDRIYTRLGINSRTALVRYAIEAGLLPPKH